MATYMPSPGPFKGADADPDATLELFEDYLDKMEKVFRLLIYLPVFSSVLNVLNKLFFHHFIWVSEFRNILLNKMSRTVLL